MLKDGCAARGPARLGGASCCPQPDRLLPRPQAAAAERFNRRAICSGDAPRGREAAPPDVNAVGRPLSQIMHQAGRSELHGILDRQLRDDR